MPSEQAVVTSRNVSPHKGSRGVVANGESKRRPCEQPAIERIDDIAPKWKESKELFYQKLMQSNVSEVMDKYNCSNRKSFKLADAMFDPKISLHFGADKGLRSIHEQDYETVHP